MKERIIYDNYSLWEREDDAKAFLMEEYPELCTVEVEDAKTGEITYEPSERQIWDEIYRNDEWEWNDVWHELKSFFKDKMCIMFGSVGLWTGKHAGGKIGTFEDLFMDITEDCDYWKISDENGHLYIECSHHDGTHYMEIKVLTDKGYTFSDNWEYGYGNNTYDFSEQELHRRIVSCSFLSRLPRFWERIYGC